MAAPREGKALDRRPKAESFKVEDLVQQVLDGRIRVPKFQRDLRWEVGDAEQLLDSIYRGYPIGTLLFWVRHGDAQRIEYGTVNVDAREMGEAWWVVDGQQRVNAIVRSLAGEGFPAEKFALYFDLHSEKFVRPGKHGNVPGHWLPLTEIVDSERLLDWIAEHPEIDRKLAITVGKRIREYSIPFYLVTTDDEDAVREIFARLNETGKPMVSNEVFSALYGARRGNSPSDVREVAANLAALEFGNFDHELLHSMMLATLGVDVSKNRVPRLDAHEAHAALGNLERAGRAVVVFLRETAKIPHLVLLPYELPLVTLTRFFHLFPEAHPRSRELLSRWVWRGALSGLHQGNTTSKRATLSAIIEKDEHGSVRRLLGMIHRAEVRGIKDMEFDQFRFRDAQSKLLSLAMWSLQPRHLQTGEIIHIPNDASKLFPPASITSSMLDGVLANRIIHPAIAEGSIRQAIVTSELVSALNSHGIDSVMIDALRERDYASFEQARTRRLAEVAGRLFESRVQLEASDRPPIQALLIRDDIQDGTSS
jgi:hypothetical protein